MQFLHKIQDKLGLDKICHFAISYIIIDILLDFGVPLLIAVGITAAIGIIKETAIDPVFDSGDLVADAIGIVLGVLL